MLAWSRSRCQGQGSSARPARLGLVCILESWGWLNERRPTSEHGGIARRFEIEEGEAQSGQGWAQSREQACTSRGRDCERGHWWLLGRLVVGSRSSKSASPWRTGELGPCPTSNCRDDGVPRVFGCPVAWLAWIAGAAWNPASALSRRGREGLVLVSMVVLLETAYWITHEPCSAQ